MVGKGYALFSMLVCKDKISQRRFRSPHTLWFCVRDSSGKPDRRHDGQLGTDSPTAETEARAKAEAKVFGWHAKKNRSECGV